MRRSDKRIYAPRFARALRVRSTPLIPCNVVKAEKLALNVVPLVWFVRYKGLEEAALASRDRQHKFRLGGDKRLSHHKRFHD